MALPVRRYRVKLTLIRDMLATNPADPQIMDTHILERQRKLILDKSAVNAEINKYLNAPQITEARGKEELLRLSEKLAQLMGRPLTPEQEALIAAGKLEDLRETFADFDTKGTTIFFTDPKTKRPMLGDHQVYGFLKSAAEAIGRTIPKKNGTILNSISYTQSIINQHCRCEEPFLVFDRDSLKKENGDILFRQRSLRAETAQGPRVSLAKSEMMPAGSKLEFTLKVMEGSPLTEGPLTTLFDYGEIVGLGQWRNAGNGMFSYEMTRIDAKGNPLKGDQS